MKSIFNLINNSAFNFKSESLVMKKKKRFMTTDQLKQIFNLEAKTYFKSKSRVFEVDDDNKKFLNLFCKYFAQDETFETIHKGELQKGLYIYGSNGVGKTSSFQIIQNISKKNAIKQLWFPSIEASTVVHKFNTEKNKDYVIKSYSKGIFLFDDLGAETVGSNIHIYGKEEIFVRILESRYNEFRNKGIKTYITSNLTLSEIGKRYGSRVQDRFFEMFNFLELSGDSRR